MVSRLLLIVNICGSTAVLVVLGWWLPIVMGWLWFWSVVTALLVYFVVLRNIY